MSIRILETNIVYLIDDSTGTIDARYWLHTVNPHVHTDDNEERYWAETSDYVESQTQMPPGPPVQYVDRIWLHLTPLNTVRLNKYARLIGILKSFRGRKYINVTFIETIQDPHEIFHHILDVIHIDLLMTERKVDPIAILFVTLTDNSLRNALHPHNST